MKRGESLNGLLSRLVADLVSQGVTLEQAKKVFERQFIVASLRSSEGNICRCARSLGVHRNTLRNKVATLGIAAKDYTARPTRRRPRRR